MSINTSDSLLLTIQSDLTDAQLSDLRQSLRRHLEQGLRSVELDCCQLAYVSSSHIGALWMLLEDCRAVGATIRISHASAILRRALDVLELSDFFFDAEAATSPTVPVPTRLAMPTPVSYADEFAADTPGVQTALARFLQFVTRLGLPQRVLFDLRMMFYEVATNIRIHAGIGSGGVVRFTASSNRSRIEMTFTDNGLPFDPTQYRPHGDTRLAAKNGRTRGFGIGLIRKLTDRITYRRMANSANVLTLEKQWSTNHE